MGISLFVNLSAHYLDRNILTLFIIMGLCPRINTTTKSWFGVTGKGNPLGQVVNGNIIIPFT